MVPSVPKAMAEQLTQRQLIAGAQSGSREALEKLLDLYEDRVFALAQRMVGPAEAEDAAQEALIQICSSIGGFRGRSDLSTWVYRVTVNVCLQHRRRRNPEVTPLEDDALERQADPDADPAAAIDRNQLKSRVDAAIDALPEVYRDVVVLHELMGLTYRECAAVLECPVGTVKSRLSSAFVKLRELLRDSVSEGEVAI